MAPVVLVNFRDALPRPDIYRGTGGSSPRQLRCGRGTEVPGFSQSEGGDENTASAFENPGCFPGKGFNFRPPFAGMRSGIAGIGAFENQGVDSFIRQNGSGNQGLIVQGNVAGVENSTPALLQEEPPRPEDMAGGNKLGLDLSAQMNPFSMPPVAIIEVTTPGIEFQSDQIRSRGHRSS